MKHLTLFLLILFMFTLGMMPREAYFTRHPSLTPDAKEVVFSYDGDLWKVSVNGGRAMRLTGLEGEETFPRVSPDGQWLAFSATVTGDDNVFVMPLKGGEIRQLTFNDASDHVDSWSWDSQFIYFTSSRYNNFSAYKVSIRGGTPERIFGNYFNTPHGLVEHPQDGRYFFTDTWESYRFANRKGYKGDYNPDIKSYHPDTREYKVLTTYRGKDFQPTIDRQGNLYFISDQANGEYNLYTFKNGRKKQLTRFPSSIWYPQVSSNGQTIAFEKDYQIYLYQVNSQKVKKLHLQLDQYNRLGLSQSFAVKGKITAFDVCGDGKKLAFISRGELFVSDVKGKFIKKLSRSGSGRAMEVYWLKDNRTLLFSQTTSGWLNWFKIPADGSSAETQLTSDKANNRGMSFSGTRDKAAYLSGRNKVCLLDLNTFKSQTLVEDEIWGFLYSPPRFSPDDNYIIYTVHRNFEQDIVIYSLKSKKAVNITNSGVSESEPYWSPDGKYLYFASDRHHPSYPRGGRNRKIYRIALQRWDRDFRSTELEKLFREDKKKSPPKKDKGEAEKKKPKKSIPVIIDFNDMIDRWEMVSPYAGNQGSPVVLQEKGKIILLFASNHDGTRWNIWKKTFQPFEESKTEKIKGAVTGGIRLSAAKGKYYLLVRGNIHILNLKGNKVSPINMDYSFQRNLRDEFQQMFYETWSNLQENYYDHNFHGRDWNKIKQYYARFLPHIQSRAHLRKLISDMLGELNSSHLGFYSRGKEEETFHRTRTIQTGIVFDSHKPYVVDRIVKNSAADKSHIHLKSGDRLVAINDQQVNKTRNRESYFSGPGLEKELTLTFRRADKTFAVKVHPQSSRGFRGCLYDEWVENNQKIVDQMSGGRIAYIQMKNMGGGELNRFLVEMTSEWYRKEALILDLRYNTGGNVHDDVLKFLIQKPYLQWKYRGGKLAPQPHFAPSGKPMVLLVNEQSLSDAEMTAAGFKALKLGKIIGTETYRWIIFTSGKSLVDGSFYRLPSWGCFTLEGKDLERHGVKPDIYVKTTFKDRLEGKDPQLDRAIKEILKDLKR